MTSPPDALALHVIAASCKCGNRWTHSHLWLANSSEGLRGGTPTPMQEEKLQVQQIEHSRYNYSHCFRCAPLGLGLGWTKPAVAVQTPQATSAKDELLS